MTTDTYSYPLYSPSLFSVTGCVPPTPTDALVANTTADLVPWVSYATGTSLCPTIGGTVVTLRGENFCKPDQLTCLVTVRLGGRDDPICREVSLLSTSELTCVLPPASGKLYPIIVVDADTTIANRSAYIEYAHPTITRVTGCSPKDSETSTFDCSSLASTSGRITIYGDNFGPAHASVLIGDLACLDVQHDTDAPHSILTCIPPDGRDSTDLRIVVVSESNADLQEAPTSATVSYTRCDPGYAASHSSPSGFPTCLPCPQGELNPALVHVSTPVATC